MAQDKSLKLSMKIDTSDFDRMAKELQGKLANLYGPANGIQAQNQTGQRMQGLGMGDQSSPGQQAMQRATQNHQRDLNALIKEQAAILRQSATDMAKHSSTLATMLSQQKEMVKGSAEELQIREKISKSLENERKLQKNMVQQSNDLNGLLDKKQSSMSPMEQLKAGYQGNGVKGAIGAFDKIATPIGGGIAAAGLVAAAVTAAIKTGSDTYKYLGQAPINASSASGSAMSQTVGREVSGIYGNRQAYEMAFMPEKARAAQMAMESTRRVHNTQFLDAGLDVAGGAVMGGLKGAAGGFALGGLASAGALAIPGAIVGGIGGALFGANQGYNQNKSTLLSPFSESASADRQAQLAKDFANKFSEALDGEQNKNPLKRAAAEAYQNSYSGDLASQRSMGLDYNSFHGVGGFKDQITNLGFSNDLGTGMASSILGAGGSSRSAAGNSGLGLQMQRGMNLTNAGSILGTLSGSLGDSGKTENATIKILAQGMKLGLDDSKFAEENRRFTQAAADIVSRSGATSSNDMGNSASGFSRFVTENTNAGIDSAKSAYEQYQGQSKETTGLRGNQRAAGIMADPALSQMDRVTQQALMQLPEEQINANHPVVQDAAAQTGKTPQEILDIMKGVNGNAQSAYKEYDDKKAQVRDYVSKSKSGKYDANDPNMPESIKNAYSRMGSLYVAQNGNTNARDLNSVLGGAVNVGGMTPSDQSVYNKTDNANTGRVEDTTIQGMAESSKFVNDNFRDLKDTLIPAASQIANFNAQLKQTIEILSKLPAGEQAEQFRKINAGLYGAPASAKNQDHAN